jgi:hypothetical protein
MDQELVHYHLELLSCLRTDIGIHDILLPDRLSVGQLLLECSDLGSRFLLAI